MWHRQETRGWTQTSTVPASFPEVITVSAIGDFDGKCGALSTMTLTFGGKVNRDDIFAAILAITGRWLTFAAPGENIATTQKGSSYRSDFSRDERLCTLCCRSGRIIQISSS